MKIVKQKKVLNEAVKHFENGQIVICPTDTVYGFLALASNKKAINKIYRIKNRPKSKPLPVFVKDLKMAKELVKIDIKQEKVLKKHWPGKYTFILKSKNILQTPGVCKNEKIALRIPKYKFLNDLLKKINKPLVQTSVNISGSPALTKIDDIVKQFENKDIMIIDGGDLPKGKPSSIIDLTKNKIKTLR